MLTANIAETIKTKKPNGGGAMSLAPEQLGATQPGVQLRQMLVTPELALEWLTGNTRNRPISNAKVMQYARDLSAGRWTFDASIICFNPDGVLLNGQHRLRAIIEAQTPAMLVVALAVPNEAQLNMDCGIGRRLSHFERIAHPDKGLSNNMCATANAMIKGVTSRSIPPSHSESHDFMMRHLDAIRFACEHLSPHIKQVTTASVRGAVARAWYHTDQPTLHEFADILGSKTLHFSRSRHATARSLQRWLLTTKTTAGQAAAVEQYVRTEKALSAFIRGDALSLIRPSQPHAELFPLPEEQGK